MVPPTKKRHTGLIIGLVLGGVALFGLIAIGAVILVGLDQALDDMDTYSQDLVADQAHLVEVDQGAWATSWVPNGLQMTIRQPDTWAATGLDIGMQHTVLSSEVTLAPGALAAGSSVGTVCLENPSTGYGFLVSTTGATQLVELRVTDGGFYDDQSVRPLATSAADPALASPERIMITCRIPFPGAGVELAGYVDGVKVISGQPAMSVSAFQYTGMIAHAAAEAPAEWTFTRIERLGPADMPR